MIALALAAALAGPPDMARWAPPADARVPLALAFRDEAGREVRLGALRPSFLVLGYFGCANLCGATLDGLAAGLMEAKLRDRDVVVVSVDPHEGPADALARKLRYRGRLGDERRWHFLTGPGAAELARAVGFGYASDGKQIAHPTGVLVLAPDGRVARYLGGIVFTPAQLQGAPAPGLPEVLLRCFHYDPVRSGAHDDLVLAALRIGGVATVAALAALLLALGRRR
jgi:protein SCO1/2